MQRSATLLSRFRATWERQGYTVDGGSMVEIDAGLSVDRPEQVIEAYTNAVPHAVKRYTSTSLASGDYINRLASPVPGQAMTSGRRQVPVAERSQPLLASDADLDGLTRPNGHTYLPRSLFEHADVAALRNARTHGINVMLEGDPGTGKTALADATFPDLIDFGCNRETTLANLVGSYQPAHAVQSPPNVGDAEWVWVDGPLTQAVKEGRVILLDELDRLSQDILPALHPLLDGRGTLRLSDNPAEPVIHAAEGFMVIATRNPHSIAGTPLPDEVLSRFGLRITVTTDYGAARQLGVREDIVAFAENLARKAAVDEAKGLVGEWVPQMRELLSAQRLLDAGFGDDLAVSALVGACPDTQRQALLREDAKAQIGADVQPVALGAQVTSSAS